MAKTKTLPPLWNDFLDKTPKPLKKSDQSLRPRAAFVGVGNALGGDDAAGLEVARVIRQRGAASETWLALEGGAAPENLTGSLRAFAPEIIVLVDAAHLGEVPGAVMWVETEAIDGVSASSHSLPLSLLAKYLTGELNAPVFIIGIQPMQNEFDTALSAPVKNAAEHVAEWCLAQYG
jgi:hydrogenase 3 maturation protease